METRPYEAIVILHPDSTPEEQKGIFKRNAEIIKAHKGKVNHVDTWGKRTFGNPIGKNHRGFYFHTTFEAQPETIAELERIMRINEKVLRFQHTRLEDETDLKKHVEAFKETLAASAQRERERESKAAARRAAARAE